MQFTSKVDVGAPSAVVFAALSDFDGWEKAAMRRGAQVSRTDALAAPGPGMGWATCFAFRGKERSFDITLVAVDPAGTLQFTGAGTMLEGGMQMEVIDLGPRLSRMVMAVDVRPLSLGARLVLQGLKLGRNSVQAKMNARLAAFARDIEARQPGLARPV